MSQVTFDIAPFITPVGHDGKRAERFAIMRREYDDLGFTVSAEAVDTADTRHEAEALLGHYQVAAMRER